MKGPPPKSRRTYAPLPYRTLFRSPLGERGREPWIGGKAAAPLAREGPRQAARTGERPGRVQHGEGYRPRTALQRIARRTEFGAPVQRHVAARRAMADAQLRRDIVRRRTRPPDIVDDQDR